jgi:glycosyltransferase involved in cell wall biosynthesis
MCVRYMSSDVNYTVRPRVSVCLASYNGEKFICEQMESILSELSPFDEVIVVDDCSKDSTIQLVRGFNDPRIKIFSNDQNRRHVYTFDRAISLATNDIIILADQDDVWLPGRCSLLANSLFDSGALLASSNYGYIDASGSSIDHVNRHELLSRDSNRNFKNIINIFLGRINYFGCAMAFRKEFRSIILPIPSYIESHDLWISMAANLAASILHINEKTLMRRLHQFNQTNPNRNLPSKLKSRIIFLMSILTLIRRIKNYEY